MAVVLRAGIFVVVAETEHLELAILAAAAEVVVMADMLLVVEDQVLYF
jgi:hypothetical protein